MQKMMYFLFSIVMLGLAQDSLCIFQAQIGVKDGPKMGCEKCEVIFA